MFSVVVPLWNKRHTIAMAIESALGQTWRDFEVIVVDDGSSDGSLEALDNFGDPRIRVVSQARAGPGAARNAGIEAARAGWIAFLDADDIWLPHHLAELDRIRTAHPGAGLIGTSFVSRAAAEEIQPPPASERRIEAISYFEKVVSTRRLFCTSTAAIPRSTCAALGGFGPAPWGQDTEYWVRIALARPVAASNQVTAVHRRGTGGITETVAACALGPLHAISDIEPPVALLIERYPGIERAELRRAIDSYIDWKFKGCVRKSARVGDFSALRALPRVALRPPQPAERLILMLARLPRPLAGAAYALGFRLARVFRRDS